MKRNRDQNTDFHHMIKVGVFALAAMALMWTFVSFVVRFFE